MRRLLATRAAATGSRAIKRLGRHAAGEASPSGRPAPGTAGSDAGADRHRHQRRPRRVQGTPGAELCEIKGGAMNKLLRFRRIVSRRISHVVKPATRSIRPCCRRCASAPTRCATASSWARCIRGLNMRAAGQAPARFYGARAKGGAALIITGGFSPNEAGRLEPGAPILNGRVDDSAASQRGR